MSFFLLGHERGRLGELAPDQRREVAEVKWLPLAEAQRLLAYKGERDMAERAKRVLESDTSL